MTPGYQIPAQPGSPGSVVGPNYGAQAMQPQGAQIAQGISQLLTGLVTAKQSIETHNRQKYEDAIQQIANGTLPNPDYDQIMKWAKKGGIPMKTDLTPAELQGIQQTQAQAQQQKQFQALALSGAPGMPGVADAAGQAAAAPPPGPALMTGQSPPPGFMQRVRDLMSGGGPNAPQRSIQSPMGQYLTGLNQAAQSQGGAAGALAMQKEMPTLQANVERALAKLKITSTNGIEPLMLKALAGAKNGDPESLTMLHRLDVMKGVPVDELAYAMAKAHPELSLSDVNKEAATMLFYLQGGGPALKAKMFDMADKGAERFGGDMQKSIAYYGGLFSGKPVPGLQPSMTPKEFGEYTESLKKVSDRYPAAPLHLAQFYADSKMSGRTELASNTLDFLQAHYKGSSEIAGSQFQQRLALDRDQLDQQMKIQNMQDANEQIKIYMQALDQSTGPWKEIMAHPDKYSEAERKSAATEMLARFNKLAGTTVKINGKEQTLLPWSVLQSTNNLIMDDKYSLGLKPAPEDLIKSAAGTPDFGQTMMGGSPEQIDAMIKELEKKRKPSSSKPAPTPDYTLPGGVMNQILGAPR